MNGSNTLMRSLHDLGAASWFGGSLAGAIALNGATDDAVDPSDRARIASSGWVRWSPVAAASIGAHLVGGAGLLVANRARVLGQAGAGANTAVKTVLTLAAVATTVYSGMLGRRVAEAGRFPSESATVPADDTPADVAAAQQRLRVLQWATPVLTGAIIALGSQQGEQQRPNQLAAGAAAKVLRRQR